MTREVSFFLRLNDIPLYVYFNLMQNTGIREGILFLDEVNCVSETLAPVMLQFLQYKIFGRHKVPDGWIIVTAGNPPEYNNSVREFDIVTWDRLKRIDVEPDFDVWKEYAYKKGATVCWGFENNCTRNISSKSTYEIVVLKGIFSGLGALVIALIKREPLPGIRHIGAALLLGFVAYGLSIFLYVRVQNVLGAAKTSAYYAVAPFIGAFLSFIVLREQLSWMYLIALIVMIGGSALIVADTLIRHHAHVHQHTFTHTHDGTTHTHTVTHSHDHNHYVTDNRHGHHHANRELEPLRGALHR